MSTLQSTRDSVRAEAMGIARGEAQAGSAYKVPQEAVDANSLLAILGDATAALRELHTILFDLEQALRPVIKIKAETEATDSKPRDTRHSPKSDFGIMASAIFEQAALASLRAEAIRKSLDL